MSGFPLAARVVEVIADLGEAAHPRYRYGSGCVVAGRTVLTAAHVVTGAVRVWVRDPDKVEHQATLDARFVGDADGPQPDLALVEINDPLINVPAMGLAAVDRDSPAGDPVERCQVIGYPAFMEQDTPDGVKIRETADALGHVSVLSRLARGLLSVHVGQRPRPLPPEGTTLGQSEWSGMSGAPVVVDGLLLGVVSEQAPREGSSSITATPLTALERDDAHPGWGPGVATPGAWWGRLGVSSVGALRRLPVRREGAEPMYGATVRESHQRTEDVRQYADALVTELDLPHFTGRRWLLDVIDEFLRSEDRGYFVLEADAGLGKTTFCAWLARSRRYPVHFVRIPGGADPAAALKNLAAQVIDTYGLDEAAPGGVLPSALGSPNGFARLLAAAAVSVQQARRPLVLVVDGLDEVPYQVGQMPLGLPASPPPGVYVVVSRRPGDQMLPVEAPRQYFTLQAWAEPNQPPVPNQQDMLDYLRRVASEPPLAELLAAAGLSADTFVGQLAAKCAGVWIYLRYVLEEMQHHRRPVTDLAILPDTLWQYYAQAFARSRQEDPDRWQAALLPLLATLAAAREPVTFGMLCTLAGVQADDRWRIVLHGPWRPFLQVQDDSLDAEPKYTVFHDSLREFLDGRLSGQALAQMTAERPLIRQLHHALRDRHSQIADRYLSAWGGLDHGLPDLDAKPELGTMDGGYALRWLAWHLLTVGREDDLHRLLACGPQRRNTWFAAHDSTGDLAGYLEDIRKARSSAQRLGTQLRYALIEASIASITTTLSPVLVGELVARNRWTASQAFSHIERMADEQRQAQALAHVASQLPAELLARALSVAMRCREYENRAMALQAVIPHLPDNLLERALDAVLDLMRSSPDVSLGPMVAIAARLPKDLLSQLPWREVRLWNQSNYERAVVALFRSDDRSQGARDALAEAREIDNQYQRGLLIAALLPRFPGDAFDEVLAVLGTITPRYRDAALIALARHAPAERLGDLLDFAAEGPPGSEFFHEAGRRLTAEQLSSALRVCQAVQPYWARAEAFAALTPFLDADRARRFLAPLETDGHLDCSVFEFLGLRSVEEQERLVVVSALIERLPDPEDRQKVTRLAIRRYSYEDPALAMFARYLPEELRHAVLPLICLDMGWNAAETTPLLERFAPFSDDEVAEAFDMLEGFPTAQLMLPDVLAPHLTYDQLRYARDRVMAFPIEEECFAALAEMGRFQPRRTHDETAERGLAVAAGISHGRDKARAAAALAPILLRPELAARAFEIVRSAGSWWAPAMNDMAHVIPAALLQTVPAIYPGRVRDMPRVLERLSAEGYTTVIDGLLPRLEGPWIGWSEEISILAPFLSASQARRVWHIGDPHDCGAEPLSALASRLPAQERAAAVDEVLAAYPSTFDINQVRRQAQVLGRLARAASTERLTQALREFLRRSSESAFTDDVLAELAPVLPETLIEEAFQYALSDNWHCARALVQLAPRLSGSLLRQAISHISKEPHTRGAGGAPGEAAALAALARQLPAQDRETVLPLALKRALSGPWSYGEGAFTDLIPQLPEQLRSQAVNAAMDAVCSIQREHRPSRGEKSDSRLRAMLAVLRGPELERLYARLGEVKSPLARAHVQAVVIRHAAEDHAADFFAGGRPLHHDWPAGVDRAGLMELLAASAWWIDQNGDNNDIDEVVEAIFDVTRWWP